MYEMNKAELSAAINKFCGSFPVIYEEEKTLEESNRELTKKIARRKSNVRNRRENIIETWVACEPSVLRRSRRAARNHQIEFRYNRVQRNYPVLIPFTQSTEAPSRPGPQTHSPHSRRCQLKPKCKFTSTSCVYLIYCRTVGISLRCTKPDAGIQDHIFNQNICCDFICE
uniref:Uncharacterized protein n=1 Tax=Clytia hemisphaerica TaxID=252671 RepID=A0A7M5VE68_9CNID